MLHFKMLALALVGAAASVVANTGLTDGEIADALNGKTPVRAETYTTDSGKSAGRGIGGVVIEKPVGDVWNTLSAFEKRAEFVPRIKRLDVLERQPNRVRIRQEIDATVTTARYTAWYELDETHHAMHWKIDKSAPDNTIVDVDGDYRLFELAPARTLLVYRAAVDSGAHVPQFIQNHMTKKSIPDLLASIKRRCESGDTWKR